MGEAGGAALTRFAFGGHHTTALADGVLHVVYAPGGSALSAAAEHALRTLLATLQRCECMCGKEPGLKDGLEFDINGVLAPKEWQEQHSSVVAWTSGADGSAIRAICCGNTDDDKNWYIQTVCAANKRGVCSRDAPDKCVHVEGDAKLCTFAFMMTAIHSGRVGAGSVFSLHSTAGAMRVYSAWGFSRYGGCPSYTRKIDARGIRDIESTLARMLEARAHPLRF
jgi:hypothetical protein